MSTGLFYKHFSGTVGETIEQARELTRLIRSGDLRELESFLQKFQERPQDIADLINIVRQQIKSSDVSIPYAIVAQSPQRNGRQSPGVVLLSLRLHSAQRVLNICTSRGAPAIVMAPPKNGVTSLMTPVWEDPALLFKQISRVLSLPPTVCPPPLAHGVSA